jgi:hypothetical protein
MPRELEFKFMLNEIRDNEEMAKKSDLELRGGTKTMNERRSELGLPLLDTPAADQPILVAGTGVYLFTPEGIVNASAPTAGVESVDDEVDPMAPTDEEPKTDTEEPDFQKAGVPSISEALLALSKLNTMPNPAGDAVETDVDTDDFVESPWDVVAVPTLDPSVWSKAVLTLVNPADLAGTDTVLERKKVEGRINNMGQSAKPYRSYAQVYNDGEKLIIIDGHHRLCAMWLLGMEQVPVWVASVDAAKEASAEVKSFLKWAGKGKRARQFEFKSLDPIVGDALNRCYFDGDTETMKSLAKAYLT